MKTIIKKVSREAPDNNIMAEAAKILQNGGLVAFPTETVYGLGADGLSEEACKKIFEAKGRPQDNPLILHISDASQLDRLVKDISPVAEKVMSAFWPGPITLIFNKKPIVPDSATCGLPTVAIRFPSDPVARLLIDLSGVPIAAPSANSSGKPSPTRASHVEFDLSGKIDMIIDGGTADFGLESTILDVTVSPPMLLRPGAVTKEMIDEVIGPIGIDPAILRKPGVNSPPPKAPGMKYTHYSPNADVVLVEGETDKVIEKINKLTKEDTERGLKVGVLATDETAASYISETVLSLGSRDNIEEIGANLFRLLRRFDFLGADKVYSEVFPETGEGMAVMNRLKKSAGYNFIRV